MLLGLLAFSGCKNELNAKTPCDTHEDCKAGEICASTGFCEAGEGQPCAIDEDCGSGGVCISGACTLPLGGNGEGDGDGGPGGNPVDEGGIVKVLPVEMELDFGSPSLGAPIERFITLQNVGTGPFSLTAVTIDPTTTSEFSWSMEGDVPTQIAVGAAVEVKVTYILDDGEEDTGQLFLQTTAESCDPTCADPANIPIFLFSEFKGARNLLLNPASHDFGYTAEGQSSLPQTLLITNEGTLEKVLTVSSLEVSGNTDDFQLVLPTTPLYIAPGESVEVEIVHSPSGCGDQSITITGQANSDSAERLTQTATFTGTSRPDNALVFDPPQLSFPVTAVGQTAELQSQLTNVGCDAVGLGYMNLGVGTQYSANSFPSFDVSNQHTLNPGNSVTVFVTYAPTDTSAATDTVNVYNDQTAPGANPAQLPVSGNGYVPPSVEIEMGPEDNEYHADCLCAEDVPAANIDLIYKAQPSGPQCSKPAQVTCATSGNCPCDMGSYGEAYWDAAREETVQNQSWIIDELVYHNANGIDGTFVVQSKLTNNCLAVAGSTSWSALDACCAIILNEGQGQCFPFFGWELNSYPTRENCTSVSGLITSPSNPEACAARGPATVHTLITIPAGTGTTRKFCHTLNNAGDTLDVATIHIGTRGHRGGSGPGLPLILRNRPRGALIQT
jgi:hypothetical protein